MKLLVILISLLLSSTAFAQGAVNQSGSIVRGHAAKWIANRTIIDAGTSAGGNEDVGITSLAIVGKEFPFCIYDAPITNKVGYHSLCFAANSNGRTIIKTAAAGGALPGPLVFNMSGKEISFANVNGDLAINFKGLPTGCAGRASGDLYNEANVLKICP